MGDKSVFNVLLCVGPATANVVRKMYLTGNEDYLEYCYKFYFDFDSGYYDKEERARWKKRKTMILKWMEYNEALWKRKAQGLRLKENFLSVTINVSEQGEGASESTYSFEGRRFVFGEQPSTYCPDPDNSLGLFYHFRHYKDRPFPFRVVSIGTVNLLLPDSSSQAADRLRAAGRRTDERAFIDNLIQDVAAESNGSVTLKLARPCDLFFSYAPRAIEAGLSPVLEHLLSQGLTTPNVRHSSNTRNLPRLLLCHAIDRRFDLDCFRTLLACDGINVNASVTQYARFSALHNHSEDLADEENDQELEPLLREFVRHPNVDIDILDDDERSPLLLLCYQWNYHSNIYCAISFLVENGANTSIRDPGTNQTPLEILESALDQEGWSSDGTYLDDEDRDHLCKLIAFLRGCSGR